ncbi:hypothetical protein BC628DRAFT_1416417 [Trametes gibbosa]|nr:hypothetical protein BC628DRAFT_1416417 [Trametes gibbosa]
MDAFFVIASPVPEDDVAASSEDEIFADHDRLGTVGNHGSILLLASSEKTYPTFRLPSYHQPS